MLNVKPFERSSLEFSGWKQMSLGARYAAAFGSFAAGVLICAATDVWWPLWLAPIVFGHSFLWCKRQRTAPGGATPKGDLTWAPADPDWHAQMEKLEQAGERWDASPWDISSPLGFTIMLLVLFFGTGLVYAVTDDERQFHMALSLWLPVWFNGMRSNWNPSELRLKGEALRIAEKAAMKVASGRLEAVPLLALRKGKRGPYPVDARMMLRPKLVREQSPFIGVQVQVALNNVKGRDLPYLYCVLLMKEGHEPPVVRTEDVTEPGENEGVRFTVVRQYADNSGGYKTEPTDIERLVTATVRATEALT